MAKTKEQLEADNTALQQRVAELESQVAAGGTADHAACESKFATLKASADELQTANETLRKDLATKQEQLDGAIANVRELNVLLSQQAVQPAGGSVVEVVMLKDCGAVQCDETIGFVLLQEGGPDLNFLVDAVRSNIARAKPQPVDGE